MRKIVGYCGIICSDCPVLWATLKDDDVERRRVAEMFTRQYRREYRADEINCDGCLSDDSRVFGYCSVCEIRKCGKAKGVSNCGFCADYPCEWLSKLFSEYGKAKETLDEIRREYGIV